MTAAMLKAIVDYAERSGSLADLHLTTACVIGYAAFLCFNKLVHIKAMDIKVKESFMSIQILQSKVVVFRTGSKLCPVSIFKKYIA